MYQQIQFSIRNILIITKMGQNKILGNTGPGIVLDKQTDSSVFNVDPDIIKNYKWTHKTC